MMVVVSDTENWKKSSEYFVDIGQESSNWMLPYLIGVFLFYIMQKYCDLA